MNTEDWIVLVIDEKTNEVEFLEDVDTYKAMHFTSQYDAEKEVTSWDTSGNVYRYINLND